MKKIYILDRSNPEYNQQPEIFIEADKARLIMEKEYENTKKELENVQKSNEGNRYSFISSLKLYYDDHFASISTISPNEINTWEWHITEHEIRDAQAGNKIGAREWAALICDAVEDLLTEYEITIPDEDRTDDDDEACLFGRAYDIIEESVQKILKNLAEEIQLHPTAEYDFTEY